MMAMAHDAYVSPASARPSTDDAGGCDLLLPAAVPTRMAKLVKCEHVQPTALPVVFATRLQPSVDHSRSAAFHQPHCTSSMMTVDTHDCVCSLALVRLTSNEIASSTPANHTSCRFRVGACTLSVTSCCSTCRVDEVRAVDRPSEKVTLSASGW